MDEFRSLLRSRLKERGALARLSEASDIPSPVIGRWRDGIGRPTDTNLRKLAPALGVPYEELARMCGYLAGEPSMDLDPRLGAMLAAIEAGWRAMDDTTRDVAERGTRALFATPAAANTSGDSTANHSGKRLNNRKRGLLPPLESQNRRFAGVLVAICSPFLRRPASEFAAVSA